METQTVQEKETLKETADDLVQHAGDYLETFYKKSVLQVTQKSVNAGASVLNAVIAGVTGFFVLTFASIGLGWLIGDIIHNRAGGYFLLAGFYLLILIIILACKKSILSSLRNMIIRMIYD